MGLWPTRYVRVCTYSSDIARYGSYNMHLLFTFPVPGVDLHNAFFLLFMSNADCCFGSRAIQSKNMRAS